MSTKKYLRLTILFIMLAGFKSFQTDWLIERKKEFNLYFTEKDKDNIPEYIRYIDSGVLAIRQFFNDKFTSQFDVFVHPDRKSLDSQWRKDWNIPDFKSECWMVASGVATRLDLLSPGIWSIEACEHDNNDKLKTQQVITHELVHVYHGQVCRSKDFSDISGIDWFVEGLATYVSGQCDSERINEVKKAILKKETPGELDKFWTGNLRYAISGSMVMYIDKEYGRARLSALLKLKNKIEILSDLQLTEEKLISKWIDYISGVEIH